MMLPLLRARALCMVTTAVLAIGTTTAALDELRHAGSVHDLACGATQVVAHDASSHGITASDSDRASDDHCLWCHLARTPRVSAQTASSVAYVDEASSPRPIAAIGGTRSAAFDTLPPRAPPSLA